MMSITNSFETISGRTYHCIWTAVCPECRGTTLLTSPPSWKPVIDPPQGHQGISVDTC